MIIFEGYLFWFFLIREIYFNLTSLLNPHSIVFHLTHFTVYTVISCCIHSFDLAAVLQEPLHIRPEGVPFHLHTTTRSVRLYLRLEANEARLHRQFRHGPGCVCKWADVGICF